MTYDDFSQKYESFRVPSFRVSIDGEDIVKKYQADIMSVSFEDAIDVSHRFSFTVNDVKTPNSQLKMLDS